MKRESSCASFVARIAALAFAAAAPCTIAAPAEPTYANLHGTIVLDNERVSVQRFVIAPGQSTGRHIPGGNQLLVFIRGGILTSTASGRSVWWRDGRVVWQGAGTAADAGYVNAGSSPIELMWVTVKPVKQAGAKDAAVSDRHLNYPNIPGEDLLENDFVIVQRFAVGPGAWEGVHAHVPNMLYIHIHGGQWAARSKHEPEHLYPEASPDGEVGWQDPIDISQKHESGNVGKTTIDLIWVTLK
jgi:quercetin dioxygenase-like cupin family protein